MKGILKLFLLIALIGITSFFAWRSLRPVSDPPSSLPSPRLPVPEHVHGGNADQGASRPDLYLAGVRANIKQGQKYIEVRVGNNGSALATDVEGVCSYVCSATGVRVVNQSFVQGGYLVPGKTVSGLLALTPCPDSAIEIRCLIDPDNVILELNEGNNRWQGVVHFR